MNMNTPIKIAIYARQSLFDTVGISADAQIEECKIAAERKFDNYLIEWKTYRDIHSPTNTDHLLFLTALENDIRENKFNVIYIYDLSRIGYSATSIMQILGLLISNDIEFVILRDEIDSYQIDKTNLQLETIFNVGIAEEQRKRELSAVSLDPLNSLL